MIRLAARYRDNTHPLYERAMAQLARELLLAQSSDWAFIMKTGTTVPYAVKRTKDHILRFRRLAEQLENGWVDEGFLSLLESRDNIFPHLHWRHYL
jgi:1,4-alpha-glucan branching enzyme